jgi:hypothetical protein
MKRLRISLASLALVLGAATAMQAQTPPPPPPPPSPPAPPRTAFDPTGVYELQITFGGQAMPITLELWKEKGAWTGTAGNPNLGTAAVTTVTQDGRSLKVGLRADAESGPITYSLSLTVKEDKTVDGTWEGNGDGSALTGKKTK